MDQELTPRETLFYDLDQQLNQIENQETINMMIILDGISKLLKRDGIDNIIDLLIHKRELNHDLMNELISFNQNISKDFSFKTIKASVTKAYGDIKQKLNQEGQFKRITEAQRQQFLNPYCIQHNNRCVQKTDQLCLHEREKIVQLFCNKCKNEHRECLEKNKMQVQDIFDILYNNQSQRYTVDGIDITCSINPQLVSKLKLQTYEQMAQERDFNAQEFAQQLFQIKNLREQFTRIKQSIDELVDIHNQRHVYQQIKIRQNDCNHADSRKLCLKYDCRRQKLFCRKCENHHLDHPYLNEIDIKNIDPKFFLDVDSINQTYRFVQLMNSLIKNNQLVIDDQFLQELAKNVIDNMHENQIKLIDLQKFQNNTKQLIEMKDWKDVFREKVKCQTHNQENPIGICLEQGCDHKYICDKCQTDHQGHAIYEVNKLKPLFQNYYHNYVQQKKVNSELDELLCKTYFPEQYLNQVTLKPLRNDEFQEEVRQAFIRDIRNQEKTQNQTLNYFLNSYLEAYLSSYSFQENLKSGLTQIVNLEEAPQMDNNLNPLQKQYFNEIVDITRFHKYIISFYKNFQLTFRDIYSQNFIKQEQYDLLLKLSRSQNLEEQRRVIQQYANIRSQLMITQGQSILFRDIQQLVSQFDKYLGLDIVYILKQQHSQDKLKCSLNIVQKLDIHIICKIELVGILVKNTLSLRAKTNNKCELSVYKRDWEKPSTNYITFNTDPGLDYIKLRFLQPLQFNAGDKISIILNFQSDQEFYYSEINDQLYQQNLFSVIQDDVDLLKIDNYVTRNQQKERGIISALILKQM